MRAPIRVSLLAVLIAGSIAATAAAQAPPEPVSTPSAAPVVAVPAPNPPATVPTPGPMAVPTPVPTQAPAMRITDPGTVSIARLPAENPYGSTAQVPAALPTKIPFADSVISGTYYASVRVDPTGKAGLARRERDPIPSLSAEALKSFARWTFTPGRRGGQAVDTWGAYKIELSVEVRSPRILQQSFVPITPATPIPTPLAWGNDNDWLESRKPAPPTDGSVPIEQVDTAPIPQKTPWSADSYKGPFSVKLWVHVDKSGHVDRSIVIEISDPVLIPYFRRSMGSWILRPAQNNGAAADSWNELALSGQISYSVDIRQIAALRRPLG
ncbi:MAG TPA: hypothetical protein VGH97_05400 [Thermoanaerobaculia bacterium]